ncbi:MAG: carbon storage regulator CsrA [Candidatus Krumholzibacteriota bacterium]|nr:carbon storage regulator CsrA [Candidatus Krumholzibacteriota bacterium]
MLVLSRKRDQSIMVGNDVRITIVEVRGDTVQLGIEAPRRVAIYREEIYTAIQNANREAAAGTDDSVENLGRPKPPSGT